MAKEAGTALAVLAIYVLTLLAPLHHARASQLAFDELGCSTITPGWGLCTPGVGAGTEDQQIAAKCPAMGAGKSDIVVPELSSLSVRFDRSGLSIAWLPATNAVSPRQAMPPCGSRAPPCAA